MKRINELGAEMVTMYVVVLS